MASEPSGPGDFAVLPAADRIDYSSNAAKALRKIQPQKQRKRIAEAIEALVDDPRPDGCTKLTDGGGAYRIRVGDYRIVYDILDGKIAIQVVRIGHRREVYR